METVFCGKCGHVFARGDNVSIVWHTEPHTCPGCGASPAKIMSGFSDMSAEDIRQVINPTGPRITLRPGEDIDAAMRRAMRRDGYGDVDAQYSRAEAVHWASRVFAIMIVCGLLIGGTAYYMGEVWYWSIGTGMLGGMMAGMVADWILTRFA